RNASTSVGAEILARIQAECRDVAQRTRTDALVTRTLRLCRVFDDPQIVTIGNFPDLLHVARLTVEVHRDDGLRTPRDSCFNFCFIDIAGVTLNVDEDWPCADIANGFRTRNDTISSRHDLVAPTARERLQSHPNAGSAARDASRFPSFTKKTEP